jgi:hypothetical protein
MLCIPDAHIPYHDEKAMALVMQVADYFQPDITIVMGDWWDCWSISSHEKTNPAGRRDFSEEIRTGQELLNQVPGKRKVFLEGNHEYRLARYISSKASELSGLLEDRKVSIKAFVKEAGFEFVPYRQAIKIGKVYYTHDLDRAGKYAVHQGLQDTQHSFVIGHTHRMDCCVEGDSFGEARLGASFGWLGDVARMDYRNQLRARREWTLGFGWGTMLASGVTFWNPVPIIGNQCVVNGVHFKL